MSDESDSFLARWSKRKAEARKEETDGEAVKASAPSAQPGATQQRDEPAEIPLEDLPPIDSITAETDLTPWLRKRVPEAWRQAALSRAWAADPAISQFTGLADYAWDWNVPDGVPGFGPMRAADDVAQLLAQAIGRLPEQEAPETGEAARASQHGAETQSDVLEQAPTEAPEKLAADHFLGNEPIPETSPTPDSGEPATGETPIVRRRRGGGALPT